MNSQLHEVRILADLAHQVTQVTATGWDYNQGQTISVTSQTTSLGPGSGQTGGSWLQQALGARSEQLAQYATLNAIGRAGPGGCRIRAAEPAVRGGARRGRGQPGAARGLLPDSDRSGSAIFQYLLHHRDSPPFRYREGICDGIHRGVRLPGSRFMSLLLHETALEMLGPALFLANGGER